MSEGRTPSLPLIGPVDLAWAAGVFEGEGSIRIAPMTKHNNGALLVEVTNTDQEMVQVFQERWDGVIRHYTASGNRRDYYRWRAASRFAGQFLRDVLPYLRTARVREKAELGLAYQAQKTTRHLNREPAYRAHQEDAYAHMKLLNRRGR